MAGLTGGNAMNADQRKAGDVVLKEDPLIPGVFIVAITTVFPQFLFVHVDCLVTVIAGDIFQGIHSRSAMAGGADQILMLSPEGERSVFVMVETGLPPALHVMALLTLLTITPLVLVILFVTGKTALLQLLGEWPLGMTGIALDRLMSPFQRKLGVFAVIKNQLFPIMTVVTLFALLFIASVVHVVDQVTAITILRRILVMLIGVAELTVDLLVTTDQLVFGVIIVIKGLLTPTLLVMALVALFAQLAIVSIISFVTFEADTRGITILLQFLGMAELACHTQV